MHHPCPTPWRRRLRVAVDPLVVVGGIALGWLCQQLVALFVLGRRLTPLPRAVRGQGLVEYALILVLIAIVVIGALSNLGRRTSDVFGEVDCTMRGGQYHRDNGNGNSARCR